MEVALLEPDTSQGPTGFDHGVRMAGSLGNVSARIFCRKLEAELLAIDGVYKVAEDIDDKLRGQPVQLWLEDDTIKAAKLG